MITNITIKDLPIPLNKILTCDKDGISWTITATSNIIIPIEDGKYELRVQDELYKIIGQAVKDHKILRFESKIMNRSEVEPNWELTVAMFFQMCESNFDKLSVIQGILPNKIKV